MPEAAAAANPDLASLEAAERGGRTTTHLQVAERGESECDSSPCPSHEDHSDLKAAGAVEAVLMESRPCRLLRRFRCRIVAALLLALLVVSFRPRQPTWELHELRMDPATLNAFIGVVTGAQNASGPLDFAASVATYNPNWIGATVDSVPFVLDYKGERMGNGTLHQMVARRRAISMAEVDISVDLTPELGQKLMHDALDSNFEIVVGASVKALARVGPFRVQVGVQCDVTADTLKMLEDPNNVVGSKQCRYRLG